MHKRHAARPILESMEARLVLSLSAGSELASRAHAAIAVHHAHPSQASPDQATPHATAHVARSEAARAHHPRATNTHSGTVAKTKVAQHQESSSSSPTNLFSKFFKSLGL